MANGSLGSGVVLRRYAVGFRADRHPGHQQRAAVGRRGRPHRVVAAAHRRADRLRHPDAAAHRHRSAGRHERPGPAKRRRQPGQPPLGQRRCLGRPHAPRPEPQVAFQLQRTPRRQRVARGSRKRWPARGRRGSAAGCSRRSGSSGFAGRRRHDVARRVHVVRRTRGRSHPVRAQPERRPARPARHRLPPRRRTAPGVSSSTCRTTRSASTSASKARASSSNSSVRRLPENLRRRLDVTDFGTPVQTVSTVQTGDRVRMVVTPRGAWEHSAYQSDNQFVLEVRPQKVDPNKLTQGPGLRRREVVAQLPEHRSAGRCCRSSPTSPTSTS